MIRRIVFAAALVLCAAVVFANDLTLSGQMKTGILWNKTENQLQAADENTGYGSKDDAGSGSGRFRLDADYFMSDINIGFKFRMNWENLEQSSSPSWHYAFGYVKALDQQITLSAGKMGASPWGTGGPEMWRELEAYGSAMGIRVEVEPHAVPGLNAGFVLNNFDGAREAWGMKPVPMYQILAETVFGASYTHELFHVRAAVRLDSEVDSGESRDTDGKDGLSLVYRVEEYMLDRFVPGLKIWALGYYDGLGASEKSKHLSKSQNWFFTEYAPDLFTAQIRVGFNTENEKNTLYIRPSLYFHFFDNLIKAGASFEYTRKFFEYKSLLKDSWYHDIEFRPLVQLNINPNAYVAAEYSFYREQVNYYGEQYQIRGIEPFVQRQWLNIRVGIVF